MRWLTLGYFLLLTGLFWLPNPSAHTKVYYAAMAAPALLAMILAPRVLGEMLREPIVLAYLGLAAWLLLSLTWTTSDSSLTSLAKRPLYVFMAIASCTLIALRDQALLMKALRFAAIAASLAALINVTYHLWTSPSVRMVGGGALRNSLLSSHVFGFFLTFWVASWASRNEQRQWLPLLLAAPLLAACLATGSRTSLMALVIVCGWLTFFSWQRGRVLIGALAAVTALVVVLAPDWLLQRGVSFRPELWTDALRQALEAFWIGHGYDSRFVFDVPGHTPLTDPHNVELAVLLELGIVGLIAWLSMHLLSLWRCYRQRHLPRFQIASALLIYGLAAGLTEGSNFLARPNESWFIIWIPLSLIAALSISHRGLAER
ncbi:O-antigen ligase family protein [Pseudomonas subflava]|uniref:O-antigen ligase family protein n=1 Tax=Pseudomonas subflava TaxID=2952933 RepID=UPI0020799E2C|nr:O-antigen ligase family protein [Pseudomonas subflava]